MYQESAQTIGTGFRYFKKEGNMPGEKAIVRHFIQKTH